MTNFPITGGEIIDSQIIQDKVVSTVRLFRYDTKNDNERAYSKDSSIAVVEELKAEIETGLASEVFDEHAEALYNKDGDLQGYNRYTNEKLADLEELWVDENDKSAKGKVVWNQQSEQGKKLAEIAQDPEKRKSIKFSIKAKKDKCYKKNGIVYCDIAKLYGIDKVKDSALGDAEILSTEVITDSKNNQLTDSFKPASSCGQDCPCDECSSFQISINTNNLGEQNMYDAERIKKLHQVTPSLSWEQAKGIMAGDSWYSTSADWEMAEAYWKELDTETASAKPVAVEGNKTATDGENKTLAKETKLMDSLVPNETLKAFIDKGMSWEDAKAILSTMPDIDLVAAEAKWKELQPTKTTQSNTDKTDKAIQDNKNKGVNPVPENNRNTQIDQEIRDNYLRQKADSEFNLKVDNLFEGKELTDSNKNDIRQLARNSRIENKSDQTALALAKHEVTRIVNSREHATLLDSRRNSLGYSQGNGQSATNRAEAVNTPKPWQQLMDNYEELKEEIIAGVKDDIFSGVNGVKLRRARKKELRDSKFFKELIGDYERNNYQDLCDAVNPSQVHGPNTARQREKLFNLMVLEEEFYTTTTVDNVYQALSPRSKFNVKPPIVPGSKAKAQNIGGILIMPLKTVSEDPQAKAKHYRPARNVGKIGLVSTNYEYNRFATRARRAGAIYDDENWIQLMQAQGWDVRVENAMDTARALGRSIDDEIVKDFVNAVRQHNAVNMCAVNPYTPAATEWIANTGANKLYGNEVTYYAVLPGPYQAGTLTVSNPKGTNHPAPLVEPLPLPYIDQLTGDLVEDYIPFDIKFSVPGATKPPCLGYKDKLGNPAPYEDRDEVTHFIDTERSIVAFNGVLGVTANNKPIFTEAWYATNYELWSKSQGLISSPFASGIPSREKGEEYINRVVAIAGEMADERNVYPMLNIGRYGFMNSYVNNARTFEKQVSPVGANLDPEHGYGTYLGEKSNIKFLKTNNPTFPNSTFMGLEGCGFYALGHVYGVTSDQQVTIGGGVGQINTPANGIFRVYGQLDVVGFPRFLDGREFPGYEQIIVD